jgi:hypothetical protein
MRNDLWSYTTDEHELSSIQQWYSIPAPSVLKYYMVEIGVV